jgi:hypothetical protein
MVIAAILLLLAVVNITMVLSVVGSGDGAMVGSLQIRSAQAFYAAESGAVVVVRAANSAITLPPVSTSVQLGGGSMTFESLPAQGAAGEAVILGTCGSSTRRIKVTLGLP